MALSIVKYMPFRSKYFKIRFQSTQPEHVSIPEVKKVVNVAIVGAPNSGKSTLINNIVDRKICPASNKVHTTTKLVRAICYQNDTQIIFLDTPGVVSDKEQRRYKLPDSMLEACQKSLRCADVIGVVHDVSNRWTKDFMNYSVLQMLKLVEEIPAFLVLNKVDVLKSKKQLLSIIRNLTNGYIAGNPIPGTKNDKQDKKIEQGYSKFSDVFLVSALKGDGVINIKEYLVANAKPGHLHYRDNMWTDQTPESLIEQTVRAKLLDFLADEIPYKLDTKLEYYEVMEKDEKIICSVVVQCLSERLARLISGIGGGRLQQIKSSIRDDLVNLFRKRVIIDIVLKVKAKSQKVS